MNEPEDTIEYKDCRVHIFRHTDPDPPDRETGDIFLVTRRRGTLETGGFPDYLGKFVAPKERVLYMNDGDGYIDDDNPEHMALLEDSDIKEPKNNSEDPHWREAYLKATTDVMEQFMAAAGEEISWTNEEGQAAGFAVFEVRRHVWTLWTEYREAHERWGVYWFKIADYYETSYNFQGKYDGTEYDARGNWEEAPGLVIFDKKAGWHTDLETVARSVLKEWNKYFSGEVYGYVLEDEHGDEVDSCWGYYGEDNVKEAAMDAAKWYDEKGRKQLNFNFSA